jgi:HEPN domain-containing protein
MPPEQVEEIRAWLVKAVRDLEAARLLLGAEVPLLDIAVYHCQQSMEKALKGFLTAKDSPFAKTHALVTLVEQAAEIDSAFESLIDQAESLSPFAWRFRYPGEALEPDMDEARQAIEFATEALDFILEHIAKEAHP